MNIKLTLSTNELAVQFCKAAIPKWFRYDSNTRNGGRETLKKRRKAKTKMGEGHVSNIWYDDNST